MIGTPGHDWFSLDRGWIDACELKVGEKLVSGSGETLEVVSVETWAESAPVYNFEVEDWHTYFVADDVCGEAVWVHNDGCGTKRIALGRWKVGPNNARNDFYFDDLVVGQKAEFLGFRRPSNSAELNALARGDELFPSNQTVTTFTKSQAEEITRLTRQHLLSESYDEILFDLRDLATVSNKFGLHSDNYGYHALAELKILLDNPHLLKKTKFFDRGEQVFPTIEQLKAVYNFPPGTPPGTRPDFGTW